MRIFPSQLPPDDRRVYKAATLFYLLVFAGMLWPIYPFFSRIEPRIAGIPLALAYLIILLLLSFGVLLALYLRQRRRGELD